MISLSLETLGCKLNQLESEAIAESFTRSGFSLVPWGAPADILVVNTCTVTSKAEQKARRIIRKALRDNPASCIIVTGCYAQLDGSALAALEGALTGTSPVPGTGRLFVVSGDRKAALLDLPRYLPEAPELLPAALSRWQDRDAPRTKALEPFAFMPEDFSFHSRAFLKIQDGCDHACAYCRVSLARGRSVSLAAETVLERLRALEDRGYAEAVLTGVNINQYAGTAQGALQQRADLGGLLALLLRGTSRIALRLSSLEPEGITPEFLSALEDTRIRPHFHLSIQSGSNRVLEKMRRWYTQADIEAAVEKLRAHKGDPFLACDIITGFPGETDGEFDKTYALCERIGFSWIHAFPYSRRPGTEAYAFPQTVSEGEAAARVEALLTLARQGRAAYIRRWLGKTVAVIPLSGGADLPGYTAGITENYLKVLIHPSVATPPPGRTLECVLCPNPESALPASAFSGGNRYDAIANLK
ncbi:tRNA (N(6)-L-threonylcarbamoyladenosine(37)-C(2))-methylthiotransferase MtaB [Spirochaetia bacterium]|nr:tRNA (N(6)-L-threonylcarbamoyladenosine(37)-C(2))-methylthiotransferase MtaB [Spirochaetia bacterium]